jgi:hypothetical protein
MKICTLLHFYQPPNQQPDILMRIVNESYLPITRGLLKSKKGKLVVNISGCLTEMLMAGGYEEVVTNLIELAKRGQVEFTGSAMYHAFLPLLPEDEVRRQIEQNIATNKKYFGDLYSPVGFFSPEMAVSPSVLSVVQSFGYKWIAAPELSYIGGTAAIDTLYKDTSGDFTYMFRNKRVSSLMLSGVCHDAKDFIKETTDLHAGDEGKRYFFTVMDAETFGHHRIGHEKLLFDILNDDFFQSCTVSELLLDSSFNIQKLDSVRSCTWTNSEQDFWLDKEAENDDKAFLLWRDPSNPIHTKQWELANLVVSTVTNYKNKDSNSWKNARMLLDRAISSDQFWWASGKPWWSLEMIEQGAFDLKAVLSTLDSTLQSMKDSETLYRSILDIAFDWQRSGYIRSKHLDNSGTYLQPTLSARTHDEWFNQLVLEFEDEMNHAAANQDFEKAIKWRDAVLKISLGIDIYDVLHVVDELWTVRTLPSVKPFLSFSWEEFSAFAKEHFKGAANKEQFELWKQKHGSANLK